jgi:hypothetical protein
MIYILTVFKISGDKMRILKNSTKKNEMKDAIISERSALYSHSLSLRR